MLDTQPKKENQRVNLINLFYLLIENGILNTDNKVLTAYSLRIKKNLVLKLVDLLRIWTTRTSVAPRRHLVLVRILAELRHLYMQVLLIDRMQNIFSGVPY